MNITWAIRPQGMPLLGGGGSGDPAAGLSLVSETVGAVVPGWLRPAPACHPKIWELVKYLEQYRWEAELVEKVKANGPSPPV